MNLEAFTSPGGDVIRTALDERGEPLFVASDVAKALGYREAYHLTRSLDDDEKGPRVVGTPGGEQQMTVITEAGLYAAILGSRVGGARAFKRWVTHEVLPAIRKRGGYLTPEATEAALTDPDFIIRLATSLKEERAARERVEAYAAELEPAAEAWSEVMDADGTYDLNTVAKMLGTGRVRLMAQLRADKVLTRDNLPMQSHVDCGRFTVKVGRPWTKPDGSAHVSRSCRVTSKGLDWLASRYGQGGTQYALAPAVGW